jgi:DNA polymerase-3 subunit epsilon
MFKHLHLTRPLVFLDLETTGVDPRRDRIVEIALIRFACGVRPRTRTLRLNPQQPIPAAATAIHGIRTEDVASCPTFAERADMIAHFFDGADMAGFGVARFDLPFLVVEFQRAGSDFSLSGRKVVDALTLFHRLEPRDLTAAVRRYCRREHAEPHRAGADVRAAVAVLDAILGKHKELPREIDSLHDLLIEVDIEGWFRGTGSVLFFARGKHRGTSLEDVAIRDASYLRWLADRVMPDAGLLIEKATDNRRS